MKGYTVINYSPEYYEQVNALWIASDMGGIQRGDNNKVIMDTIDAGGHLLLLVTETGELIGTSWLTNDKRRTFIHHFCVKENYRKKGLGKLLLDHSLEIAREDGYQVKLEVHGNNDAARKLYESFGFKHLEGYMVLIIRDIKQY